MTKIVKKESGVAKFEGDEEFIPSSCRLLPKLDTHGDLVKTDDDTIKELAKWNEILTTCKKALTLHIKRQAGRDIHSMKKEHQKVVLHDILEGSVLMVHFLKKFHNLGLLTTKHGHNL